MDTSNAKKKLPILYGLPLLHFLASFIYERFFFRFGEFSACYTDALKPEVISDSAEYIMTYLMTKIIAAVLIFLLWRLIFAVGKGEISKKHAALFGSIFLVGLLVNFITWPDGFDASIDNYITYAYATRFIPFYWHHVFTGCLYGGIMQVIPHPFALSAFQVLAVVLAVAYLFIRVEKSPRFAAHPLAKWWILAAFALPETYVLCTNPYRNIWYAILCLFFFSVIMMDGVDGRELIIAKRDANAKSKDLSETITVGKSGTARGRISFSAWIPRYGKLLWLIVLASVITLWRSEGLVLGIVGLLFAFIFAYKLPVKKIVIYFAAFLLVMECMGIPQKLGQKKYYGNDYLIVSTLRPVQYILNANDGVLIYPGGEEDVAAIDAIVPVSAVRQLGLAGYMTYNRLSGREDVDQSFATDEAKSAYLKAYVRMVLHNPKPYLISQINYFYRSLGMYYQYDAPEFTGEELWTPTYWLSMWDQGKEEFMGCAGVTAWSNNSLRRTLDGVFDSLRNRYLNFVNVTGAFSFLHIFSMFLGAIIVVREFILFCMKKRGRTIFGVSALLWMGELVIILLAMPYSYDIYLYPFLFTMYALEYLYFMCSKEEGTAAH